MNRQFSVGAANKAWCADITYLWTDEGWLYLAAVIDVGTRKLVGWAMGDKMKKSLILSALDMAVKRQSPEKGLIQHSDHGSQYASKAYRRRLRSYGMVASMSKKGDCWDNAFIESFFHSLKVEHVFHQHFSTRAKAISSVFEWIEVFYNRQRLHSSLGFLSPECYERKLFLKWLNRESVFRGEDQNYTEQEWIEAGLAAFASVVAENTAIMVSWLEYQFDQNYAKISSSLPELTRDTLLAWMKQSIQQNTIVVYKNFQVHAGFATYNRWERGCYDEPRSGEECAGSGIFRRCWPVFLTETVCRTIPLPNWNQF